jgi:hypothetical protein
MSADTVRGEMGASVRASRYVSGTGARSTADTAPSSKGLAEPRNRLYCSRLAPVAQMDRAAVS